ncbi:SulP family inorganic anion transporter [Geminocystis sp. NIES-3709]|uniref:SulP family inorganic anion transporter n=1 Tax=Geminocystis sp. NIES-3709 TaxID=1617448 RepID=UPI0005FCB489|nr:SulP family inorganic anion transporter [Geminocystis sp. NIES-3709]BAQ65493.1 sulfate permease [Geminocystis sp. NIES-3709]
MKISDDTGIVKRISRWVPGIITFQNYNSAWLQSDIQASLAVVAVVVPVAIAYAELAGLPPVNGLYASIFPLIAYGFFGSSRQLIVGTDAATCSLVATTLAPLASGDIERYISLSMVLAILAGIASIGGGIVRLGFLRNFLSRPILIGYLNGIALSIILGQLGKLFGFSLESKGFFLVLWEFFGKLGQTHGLTLTIGLSIFILLRILKKIAPKIPSALIAVTIAIIISFLFDLDQQGVAIVGTVPSGFPPLKIPQLLETDIISLIIGGVGIAFVSFNSAMVTAEAFAMKNRYEIDPNQELIALGMANIVAGVSQGFAISGTASRTATNDSAGGKTQLVSIIGAIMMIFILLFFTTPLSYLPISVLSALLIDAVLGLLDIKSLKNLYKISLPEWRLSVLTTLGVICIGVLQGVLVAIILAVIQLLYRASRPNDAILGIVEGKDGFHNIERETNAKTIDGLIMYRFEASLFFFNANFFKSRVLSIVNNTITDVKWFLLDAESISSIDSTATVKLEEIWEELTKQDIILVIARTHSFTYSMLEKTGLTKIIGEENFFPTISSAISAFHNS